MVRSGPEKGSEYMFAVFCLVVLVGLVSWCVWQMVR